MTSHHPWLKHRPEDTSGALESVSWDACALWHVLLHYMAKTGTDGELAKSKLTVATGRRLSEKKITALLPELFAEGLLVDLGDSVGAGDHWHQPPVETWTNDVLRARWQRGKALLRMNELTGRVKERDRHLCRYCGQRVNWTDRRGRLGGTYDHVDPDGTNSFENVVVACRACNGRKKDRTPDQAGMPLYRPGTTAQQIADGSACPIAASAGHAPSPTPRSRSSDQIGIKSGSDRRAGSPRAPARDRTDPTRTRSGSDRDPAAEAGSPHAPSWSDEEIESYPHPHNVPMVDVEGVSP